MPHIAFAFLLLSALTAAGLTVAAAGALHLPLTATALAALLLALALRRLPGRR